MVELKIGWTINWFRFREQEWMEQLSNVRNNEWPVGFDSYCHKQMDIWALLARESQRQFKVLLGHNIVT